MTRGRLKSRVAAAAISLFVAGTAGNAFAQDPGEPLPPDDEAAPPEPAPEPPPPPPPPPPAEPAPAPAPAPVVEPEPSQTDVAEETAEEEAEPEEITVTGSRIRTTVLDAPAPVLTLSSEDMARSGLTSTADVLQRLPVSGGGLNTKFNSSGNAGFPPDGGGVGAGAAEIALRYLGSKRTLVLVDGVRWVLGSSASGVSGATDLNTIPKGIIERVEVLEDGASAIYGSDAIAGVVNIITKDTYDIAQANAYVGGFVNEGDGLTQDYDVTWGAAGNRTRTLLSLNYTQQDEVWARDRTISSFPVPNFDRCTAKCSSATPQGRFIFTQPGQMEELDLSLDVGTPADGAVFDPVNPTGGSGTFNAFDDTDRFNYQDYNYMLTPSRRFGVFQKLEHDFTDNVTGEVKAVFNQRRSRNQAAPEPLFIGSFGGNGNRVDRIDIDVTNPYNPLGFTLDAETMGYGIFRRPVEAGPRLFKQVVNTIYLSGGVNGDFEVGDRDVYWDVTSVYSVNRADQIKTGGFNSARLEKALGPLDICLDDPQCVPFNLFGGMGADGQGSITEEMLDYVTFEQHDISQQRLVDVVGNISTGLAKLPAGWLGLAVGAEYRYQDGFFKPDAIVTAGDTSDVPAQPTAGDFWAGEAYGEVVAPILKDAPGVDLLDVSGAVRYSNYSTFGGAFTFKTGLRYRPVEDLMFRASFSQGFRAPNIGELYGSEARFDQEISDPCSDILGLAAGGSEVQPKPVDIQRNCIDQGVPADGSYEQLSTQIGLTTGGNRDLEPEQSNGYMVGLVYSPRSIVEESTWADQLDIELNWWHIDISDSIRPNDAQLQLDGCARTGDPVLCEGIERGVGGNIVRFDNRLHNVGELQARGLDVNLTYMTPNSGAGRFRFTSMSTYLYRFNESLPTGQGERILNRAGKELGDPMQAWPRLKSNLIIDWFQGPWIGTMMARYIHSVEEECRDMAGYPGTCSDPNMEDDSMSTNQMDATFYLDASVSFTPEALDEDLTISLGVNNILNVDPPACYSCQINGFDATTYDVPGIFGWLRAGYSM